MPKRDWCPFIATTGWGVALLLGSLLFAVWVAGDFPSRHLKAGDKASQAHKQARGAKHALLLDQEKPPASKYKAYCEKSENQYDCLAQLRMADAAEIQAKAAEEQAWYTLFGLGLLFFTLVATTGATIAAMRAANVAKETLIATQRAWLERIEINICGTLRRMRDGAMGVGIAFKFKNIGNAPALHVRTYAWLLPGLNGRIPWREAEKRFNEVKSKALDGGFVVYPRRTFAHRDDPSIGMPYAAISNDQIEAACDKERPERHIMLYVAACIDYTFPSDAGNHHQANFLMAVRRTGGVPISANDVMIHEDQLRLRDAFSDYYPAD